MAACGTTPPYQVPSTPAAPAWREPAPGWIAAAPADALSRGPWWSLFDDPVLNQLTAQVQVSNQNVAAAQAAVAESWAVLRGQRAALFPAVTLDAGATRSKVGGGSGSNGTHTGTGTGTGGGAGTGDSFSNVSNRFNLGLDASWEPDLWGKVSANVSNARAHAQATEADLANATLSAQSTFVADYLSVREADAETAILQATIDAYARALQITQNRYDAAIAQKSDVLQAQTQLAGAQADLAVLRQQRAQLAHAIAVLLGQAPSTFVLPAGDWKSAAVPAVPIGLPSELLQRRPDIASAERAVAAANANIGVARSAWFPAFTLSASIGQGSNRLADLFNASATTWSFGLAVAQTVFNAGANTAAVDAARATWQQSVAQYRQTVLGAFQEVEDQLSQATSLEQQQALRRVASAAADQTEQELFNRYQQGINAYTDVVTAQTTALAARRTLIQVTLQRQTAAVSLIAALGGGWTNARLAEDTAQAPSPASAN